MADKKIGKVVHYYDKIGVAVVELSGGGLAVGDEIKISYQDNEFIQKVGSIQVEHKQLQKAAKGKTIGLKVDQPVHRKAEVYKVG